MNDITKPLILWRGSHTAGSGKGCAMNVISWENGDKTITDYPECSDRMLARIVQGVNDALAQSDGSLTPEDSMRVLDLGHATVGTAYHNLDALGLKRVHVQCAIYAARKVLHLTTDPSALQAIEAAERWVGNPSNKNAYAAQAAAYADAYAAADAAAQAAAAAAAADADAYAAADAVNGNRYFRAELAEEIINLFKELTGLDQAEACVLPVSLNQAVDKMREVAHVN